MMKLILQAERDIAEHIPTLSSLARASKVEPVPAAHGKPCAWRLQVTDMSLQPLVQDAAQSLLIDAAWVAQELRWEQIKLLAMDMDSTLITIECIDEIADMQGIKPQVAEITESAMRGEIGFDESLQRRVALLAGLDAGALQRVYDERLRLSPGAEAMLSAARDHGVKTLLVSGGFTFFTERMQQRLQLDYAYSNQLQIEGGKLTGKVLGAIVNAEQKRRYLLDTCAGLGCAPQAAIAMGDGANDLLMMGVAGLSVAFRAKPKVKAAANVAFDFVGLDGLLPILA